MKFKLLIRKSLEMANSCYLQSVKNPNRKIYLTHLQTSQIGRNEESMVTDVMISRNQVEATPDFENFQVKVVPRGVNYSGCNGYRLERNGMYQFKNGDRLELGLGIHEFDIVFNPPCQEESLEEPKPKKVKQAATGSWESIDNSELLIFTPHDFKGKTKIAGFDMDGTIIRTKSGMKFPKDMNDWTINLSNVIEKLSEAIRDGYKLVIFTNQRRLGKLPNTIKEFKKKIEAIINRIGLPMQVFVATGKALYRKPSLEMWSILSKLKNDKVEIDIGDSYYVGDAAGRKKDWALKKPKDHAISDRLFALNVGVSFYTPEEFFLGARKAPFTMPEFDPRNLAASSNLPAIGANQEVIIMVGVQASGKTFYCKNYLVPKGYVLVSRDVLGTWQKCIKTLDESLQQKQSVVVDNTNPDKDSRKKYIDMAKKFNVNCRCFLMSVSYQHAKHNIKFREITDSKHMQVNDATVNMFKSKFEAPKVEEGFSEIVRVDFVPKFSDPEHEKLYKMFLLEN